ncbi:DUF1428 domain-containing protein [Halodurantibacterium flavum]|uniref:DUF1428 domain-containing protein n=1 Tax=Halodurantibacterium flavum TaxID=1382802 RepID=A0ABW4S0Q2_9RHOB
MYVDGFILAVPTANKESYAKFAAAAGEIFRELGALSVMEAWGDDVPEGKVNSMHSAVMRKEDETVVFSWTTWPDKETRDKGWAAAMADPRMEGIKDMPFDGSRMIYGGFIPIVEM